MQKKPWIFTAKISKASNEKDIKMNVNYLKYCFPRKRPDTEYNDLGIRLHRR